ncbi:MAG: hypothetical protein J5950_10270 [Clostridia bacterium]|nr:hypothetical protein [Clostridia bacterium]
MAESDRKIGIIDFVKLAAAVIVFLAIGLLGLAASRLIVGADTYKQVFRLVVLPVCAFLSGFVSLIVVRKAGSCLIAALVTNAVVFLIVMGFSWSVLLWNLLYIFSSLIGLMIAYVALTHKS